MYRQPMAKLDPKNRSNILKNKKLLEHPLIRRALQLERLTHILRLDLPENVAAHCQVARLERDILVLATDAPEWSSRLRLQQRQILHALGSHPECVAAGIKPKRLRVVINPPGKPAAPPPRQPKRLSRQSERLLRQTAQAVGDGPLRDSILRLCQHTDSADS